MAVESVQYHAARLSYHSSSPPLSSMQPGSAGTFDIPDPEGFSSPFDQLPRNSQNIMIDDAAVEQLLSFYRVCYGGCHDRLRAGLSSSAPPSKAAMSRTSSSLTASPITAPRAVKSRGRTLSSPPQPTGGLHSPTAEAVFEGRLRGAVAGAEAMGYLQRQKSISMEGVMDEGKFGGLFDRLLARLFDVPSA
jgi:hypothetical protein